MSSEKKSVELQAKIKEGMGRANVHKRIAERKSRRINVDKREEEFPMPEKDDTRA